MICYRAELAGIYATVLMVNKIFQLHRIRSEKIGFGYDGLSALKKAFFMDVAIKIDEPCFDLLASIKRAI
jgi:hypothetical protein